MHFIFQTLLQTSDSKQSIIVTQFMTWPKFRSMCQVSKRARPLIGCPHQSPHLGFANCNIRPLFQIRIFGYFSRQIRISGFYPDFFVQVRIGPYIPFSNCKWQPTDENWNAVMPKRLRDDVMCFRLQIHSQWMTKTHWRAQSQRTHSVRR